MTTFNTFKEYLAAIDALVARVAPDEVSMMPHDIFVWVAANYTAHLIFTYSNQRELAQALLAGFKPMHQADLPALIGELADDDLNPAVQTFKDCWDIAEEDRKEDPEASDQILEQCLVWVAGFCSDLDNFKQDLWS